MKATVTIHQHQLQQMKQASYQKQTHYQQHKNMRKAFTSPSVTTSNRFQLLENTPNPQDIITPETTPTTNESDSDNTPTSSKQNTDKQEIQETPQNDGLFQAKKIATQLQTTSFRDVGNLNNATTDERIKIIALSMYYNLGTFDPSNEHIEKYKDKIVLDKYKQISDIKLTKTNILLRLYESINIIKLRMDKNNDKRKNNNKRTPHKII